MQSESAAAFTQHFCIATDVLEFGHIGLPQPVLLKTRRKNCLRRLKPSGASNDVGRGKMTKMTKTKII